MRTLQRNKRDVWYCLYQGETEPTDTDGNYTGETAITYAAPVKIRANVSPATGQSNLEMFGNLTDYDRVVVTDQIDIPVDENSVLFIDSTPTEDAGEYGYDYIVRRVARSFNSVAIAVRKVDVEVPQSEPEPTPTPNEPEEPEEPGENDPNEPEVPDNDGNDGE